MELFILTVFDPERDAFGLPFLSPFTDVREGKSKRKLVQLPYLGELFDARMSADLAFKHHAGKRVVFSLGVINLDSMRLTSWRDLVEQSSWFNMASFRAFGATVGESGAVAPSRDFVPPKVVN
jgi:hypothetical protein